MRAESIKDVTCVGSGVIGAGWAAFYAMKQCDVRLYDIDESLLEAALARIRRELDFLTEKGVLKEGETDAAISRIMVTTDIAFALKDTHFIQESGPESYEIKRGIIQSVDRHAPPDAIYASSTSGLLITEISRFSTYPERCVGAHPYNPPHLIPLVEITKGELTSQETAESARAFYKRLGKEPVVLNKETPGFIGNRLLIAVAREAADLLMRDICSVEDVDKAVTFGPGLRWAIMGPNMILQLGGGDGGLAGAHTHMRTSAETWLADLAAWTSYPEGWARKAQEGVNEEMRNRDDKTGRTPEQIIRYRDDMLIEILKLHGKL